MDKVPHMWDTKQYSTPFKRVLRNTPVRTLNFIYIFTFNHTNNIVVTCCMFLPRLLFMPYYKRV